MVGRQRAKKIEKREYRMEYRSDNIGTTKAESSHKTMATMMPVSPKQPTPSLCGIPQELKSSLCDFLTAHDIAALSMTCKTVRISRVY